MANNRLLEWLDGKIKEAERALSAREQSEQCWRGGTDKEWAESAKLHSSTAGLPKLTRADRMRAAEAQRRIAEKCREEVEMFKLTRESINGLSN